MWIEIMAAKEDMSREASPPAGVNDSQSVKTKPSDCMADYDAGIKVERRKRHMITKTTRPTRPVCSSVWLFIMRISRTATVLSTYSTSSSIRSRGFGMSLMMKAMTDHNSKAP